MNNMHSGPHECSNCAQKFNTLNKYRLHLTRQACTRPVVPKEPIVKKPKPSAQDKQELLWERSTCLECGKVCSTPNERDDHMQRRHVNVKEKVVYQCAVCFKTYETATKHKRHMRCHDQPSNNKQQS